MTTWEIERGRVRDYGVLPALLRIGLYALALVASLFLGGTLPGVPLAPAGFFLGFSAVIELGHFLASFACWKCWRCHLYLLCLAGLLVCVPLLMYSAGAYYKEAHSPQPAQSSRPGWLWDS